MLWSHFYAIALSVTSFLRLQVCDPMIETLSTPPSSHPVGLDAYIEPLHVSVLASPSGRGVAACGDGEGIHTSIHAPHLNSVIASKLGNLHLRLRTP